MACWMLRRLSSHCYIFWKLKNRRFNTNANFDANVTMIGVFGEHFNSAVKLTQSAMELLHISAGFPWWTTIMVAGISLRILLLPIRISTLLHQGRQRRANQDLTANLPTLKIRLQNTIKEERIAKDKIPSFVRIRMGREWLDAMRKRNTHPLRNLLPIMLHLPLLFTVSACLRKMSAYPWPFSSEEQVAMESVVDGWPTGGLLFFSNLGLPSLPLTAIVVLSNVLTVQWIFRERSLLATKRGKILKWMMHGLNVLSAYLLSLVPSSINFFLLCNNCMTMIEGTILRSKLLARWIESKTR